MTEALSPFSSTLPKWQTAWDSTSLGWLKKCPRLYQYKKLENWSERSKGIHLVFGGWYASGVERYAHHRASGASHDAATIDMVRWVMENSGTRSEDGIWTPWESSDPIKNRYTLIRSLVWNVEDRAESRFTTLILANGRPAVELSFNFEAFSIEGETISLAGHMDEVVELDGALWVKDDKTTKGALTDQYFKNWTPNNQMSLYTLAGGVILSRPIQGVLIRAAQIGVNFTRFATRQAPRPKAVIDEWLENTKRWVKLAHTYATEDFWPMNDTACSDYGGCPFQKVCSVSPSHRQAWLQEDFEKRDWNPLISRGDI